MGSRLVRIPQQAENGKNLVDILDGYPKPIGIANSYI
jgi:hypothetical protein